MIHISNLLFQYAHFQTESRNFRHELHELNWQQFVKFASKNRLCFVDYSFGDSKSLRMGRAAALPYQLKMVGRWCPAAQTFLPVVEAKSTN
jgi:hypothetical protein